MNREQFKKLSFKKQRQYIKRHHEHGMLRYVIRCFCMFEFKEGIAAYRSYHSAPVPRWFKDV